MTEKLISMVRRGVVPPEHVERTPSMVTIRHEGKIAMLRPEHYDQLINARHGHRIIITEPLWKIAARPIGDGGDE